MLPVTICEGCEGSEAMDCPLYICEHQGFVIACCIVYAYANSLTILGRARAMYDDDDLDDLSDLGDSY